jgi:amino acid adenylation domain-containing protein
VTGTDHELARAPLTSQERGQWFLHHIAGASGLGNVSVSLRFSSRLRWWPIRQALGMLAGRHAALRQTFPPLAGGLPARRVTPVAAFEIPLRVLAAAEADVAAVLRDAFAEPFDLAVGPLVRATQVLIGEQSVLAITAHHMIVDGHSVGVLAREFAAAYAHAADGSPLPASMLAPAPGYRAPNPSAEAVRSRAADLDGLDSATMALDSARPVTGIAAFGGDSATVPAPAALWRRLADLRARLKMTDAMLLLALGAALLHRHGAGQDDLVLGIPVNLRRGPGAATAVGFHVATVPVRFCFPAGATFSDVADQARRALLDIVAGDAVSFEDILEQGGHRSADWRTPLFRHVINLQPLTSPVLVTPDAVCRVDVGGSRTDLEIIARSSDTLLEAQFSTEAHDRSDVLALLRRLPVLADAVHGDPGARLADIDLRSDEDRELITAVNRTDVALPAGTLLDLVLDMASRQPAAQAICHEGQSWDYGRLGGAVRQVGERLAQRGVRRGDRVAVLGYRGAPLAASVLGVWAQGAAYVPLDPALPPARMSEVLDGVAGLIIPDGDGRPGADGQHAVPFTLIVPAEAGTPQWAATGPDDIRPGGAGPGGAGPGDSAVVVYTSGTTGRPKGTVVSHRAMLNVVAHFARLLELGPASRVLWSTSFGFDVSALELFAPLTNGGTVVVAGDGLRLRPKELLAEVARVGVTTVQATPTLWRELAAVADAELAGRTAISGGEPLTAVLAQRLLAAGCRLFNAYGPTETTIWSTVVQITGPVSEPVPVGRPIANTLVEIMDERLRPCPPGVTGELCIGGAGVADGYLAQPRLTAERFTAGPASRWYRTGDRARWRGDGTLVLHGRTDRQVKLRGHRIELGAVESVLERHPAVRSAAVCVAPGPHGGDILAAFVQPAAPAGAPAGADVLAEQLWRFAQENLPTAEVPGRFVTITRLPVTLSGKVDYRRLLADLPAGFAPTAPAVMATDPLAADLTGLWRELLEGPGLGSDASFFLNGGHSLLAARLLTEVEDRLGLKVSYEQLFEAPTPARLAVRLRADGALGDAGAGSAQPSPQAVV